MGTTHTEDRLVVSNHGINIMAFSSYLQLELNVCVCVCVRVCACVCVYVYVIGFTRTLTNGLT